MLENINWAILALLSAIFGAFSLVLKRKAIDNEHSLEYLGVFKLCELTTMLIFIPFINLDLPFETYFSMYFLSIFITIGLLMTTKGFKRMEFTKAIPLYNLKVIFTFFASMIFLKEFLNTKQIIGVTIIIFAIYKIEAQTSFVETIKHFVKSKGTEMMALGIVILGITVTFEKMLLLESDPLSYLAIMYFFVTFNVFFGLTTFYGGYKDIIDGLKRKGGITFITAMFTTASNIFFLNALTLSYAVLAEIIRKTGIIIAMIIGGRYFHEEGYKKRMWWTVFAIVGAFLVI